MAPCELWGLLMALGDKAAEPPMVSALCSSERGEGSTDTQSLCGKHAQPHVSSR